MTNIKIRFELLSSSCDEGAIVYRITHAHQNCDIVSGHALRKDEWDVKNSKVRLSSGARLNLQLSVQKKISKDVLLLWEILNGYKSSGQEFAAQDIALAFNARRHESSFGVFAKKQILILESIGKFRTAETYASALNSIFRFTGGRDLTFDEIDSYMLLRYEAFLKGSGLVRNTTSFYMRILRAIFNKAIEAGIIPDQNPFRRVYTGIDKTIKRALPLGVVKKIKTLDLRGEYDLDMARDMFMFSFYTRGMSFVDMSFLKDSNIRNGVLVYSRRKTGQRLYIKWEKCMQDIVDKYRFSAVPPYLLPLNGNLSENNGLNYRRALLNVNRNLKKVASLAGISVPLTMYVARHSWATAAKEKNIPLSIISECMGHDSDMTTQIYLASLDNAMVDKANMEIINALI